MKHTFTLEQKDFIKSNVSGLSNLELTEMFNTHFGLQLGVNQVKAFKKNNKLSSGLDGRFAPGNVPYNKGQKGVGGWEPTYFKKGNKPWNYKPVGTERVNGDDYVDIKIADPSKWRAKHRVIWERENGPVPKGHVVIFGDGDRRNFELDNLILVSQRQLSILNSKKLIQNDVELTKTGIIVADLYTQIGAAKKRKK